MTESSGRFDGKTVVVTGGNSGIGLAAAKGFAAEGARVAIVGRNAETLETARAMLGTRTIAIQADLSSVAAAMQVANEIRHTLGQVDVLFANAGTGALVPVSGATEALWDQIMNVNLKGMYFTVQQLTPLMRDGGAIVLCSSIGAVRTLPHSSIYSASKAAINALGRAFAVELMPRQIRVNVIMPGGTDTPILERSFSPEVSLGVCPGNGS